MAHECQRDGLVKLLHRLSGRIVKLLDRPYLFSHSISATVQIDVSEMKFRMGKTGRRTIWIK